LIVHRIIRILEICPDVRVMSFGGGSVGPKRDHLAEYQGLYNWDMYIYVYGVMRHYEEIYMLVDIVCKCECFIYVCIFCRHSCNFVMYRYGKGIILIDGREH
jgi:hypothetical protein